MTMTALGRVSQQLAATLLAAVLCPLPAILAAADGAGSAADAGPGPAPGPAPAEAPPETGALLGPVRAQLAAGNVTAARIACRLLMRQYPSDPDVLVQMADIDLLLHNGGPAEVVLNRAVAAGSPKEQVLVRLGESLLQQGQPRRVLDELAPPAGDPVLAARVLALQARAQSQLDNRAAAAKLLDQALTLDPGNPAALGAQGDLARLAGDVEAARAAYARAIAAHPDAHRDTHQALAALAELDHQAGQTSAAEAGYTKALEIAPEQWMYRYERALARIDLGHLDDARQDLDQVEGAFPDFIGLPAGRAALAFARGDAGQALDLLDDYLSKVPQDQKAFGLAMQAAARTGDRARLKTLAERLQRLVPGSPGPALVTAESLLQSGDGAAALEALGPVKGLAETQPDVALLYVQVLRQAKRDDAADRALADAIGRFPDHAGLALENARRLAAQDRATEALAAVDKVLAHQPNDPNARTLRAKLLFDLGRLDEALTAAQALVEAAPTLAAGYRMLAGVRLARGDRDAAREAVAQALERSPGAADLMVTLAQMEIEAGDREAGLGHYRQALEADPNNVQAMAGLARWDSAGAASQDLAARLQAALERDPGNADLRAEVITGLLAQGRADEAIRSADATPIEQAQDGPFPLARARALAYLEAKRPDDALGQLQSMASAQPDRAETHFLVASAYAAKGEARAREAFLTGWRLDPDTPVAGAVLAQILPVLKESRDRTALATAMDRAHPDHRTVQVLQATLAAERGDREGAVQRWRALYKQEPDVAGSYDGYLRALLAAGQFDEAGRIAETWIAAHPDDWQTSLLLANGLAGTGRLGDAAVHYQRVLKLQPNNAIALNNLALYLAKTDPAAARDYAERALALHPDEPEIMDTAGTVRLAAGDAAGAADILARVQAAAPNEPRFAFHLAQAQAAAGRTAEARTLLLGIVARKFDEQAQARALLSRLEGAGAAGQ